jgi:hypothetical protein
MCESVKGWNCSAFEDPEFQKNCGICGSDGKDHLGNNHVGGLYLDNTIKNQEIEKAAKSRKPLNLNPTVGVCKGKFVHGRPKCDIDRDRDECSKMFDFDSQEARDKCGQCASNNTFLYMGNRLGKEENYSLVKNNKPFAISLKILISQAEFAKIKVTRVSDKRNIVASYIPNTHILMMIIPDAVENQEYTINIKYPEYNDYDWTDEEKQIIEDQVNPKRASLIRASYGPYIGDPEKDDPRAVDVTDYLKNKFNMKDCARPNVLATNDGLGGDPNPGIYKQLRLAYSHNGTDFAYAFTGEGGVSKPVTDIGNFESLCPVGEQRVDVERAVCEKVDDNSPNEGRIYTLGNNTPYYGAGKSSCVRKLTQSPHAICGIWESIGKNPRNVPFDLSITAINGYKVTADGLPKFGTVKSSKIMKNIVSPAKTIGIPENLFWFWAKNNKTPDVTFTFVVPATLRDVSVAEDNKLCPTGPIVTSSEAASRLKMGSCQQMYNGKPQGPGNFSDECLKSLFLDSGCTDKGKSYPNTSDKKAKILKNEQKKDNLDIDGIINKINDIYSIATSGRDYEGNHYEESAVENANMDCFGIKLDNPCNGVFKDTGPHTTKCLDYLFRNAGADNKDVGQTYSGVANRSSGNKDSSQSPIMYCQRTGSMAPIGKDGKENLVAVMRANAKGGIRQVKEFYRQIHYDANFIKDINTQKKGLKECYGVSYK